MQLRIALLTLGGGAVALAAGSLGDYPVEAAPSLESLARGDIGGFTSGVTLYAGSFTVRAPFVVVAGALGGDRLWIYRAGVFGCLLAAVALAVVLDRAVADAGGSRALRLSVGTGMLALPVLLRALDYGHPEEVLAAGLVVLAVWAAPRRRLAAGALLGLAVASKPWALVAIGPVLLCAGSGRVRLLAASAASGAAVLAPFLIGSFEHSARLAASAHRTGTLWVPFQLWWPLGTGHHHAVPDGVGGFLDVVTWTAPSWLGPAARALIVGLPLPLAALAYARGRRSRADALLLLALALHLRCLLDPWNIEYYALPAALALVAWSVERRDGLPQPAVALTALVWLTFHRLPDLGDRALMFGGYVAWAVPFAVALTLTLYGRPRRARAPIGAPQLIPARS